MTLNKIKNEKGTSYCLSICKKQDDKFVYLNEYITYAEYTILKDTFEKLGYKVIEKDFTKKEC